MHRLLLALTLLTSSVAATETLGPPVEFPNIPEIPVPAGINFGGFFTKYTPVKIVFGVADPGKQMRESLTNAAYSVMYLKPRGIPYEMEVVIYARATLAANQFNEEYAGYLPLMEALHENGVAFRVCNNSMGSLKIAAADLHPFMQVTPAGILEIAKKQMQGFHYISNPDGN